jgi:hypothetical protein
MTPTTNSVPGRTRAVRMGATLLGTGTVHFVAPKPFDDIVPAELPGSPRFYTYASGVAELTTGALLLVPRTRRLAGLAAVALFVSVFRGRSLGPLICVSGWRLRWRVRSRRRRWLHGMRWWSCVSSG